MGKPDIFANLFSPCFQSLAAFLAILPLDKFFSPPESSGKATRASKKARSTARLLEHFLFSLLYRFRIAFRHG
jgi:hypothetical protein